MTHHTTDDDDTDRDSDPIEIPPASVDSREASNDYRHRDPDTDGWNRYACPGCGVESHTSWDRCEDCGAFLPTEDVTVGPKDLSDSPHALRIGDSRGTNRTVPYPLTEYSGDTDAYEVDDTNEIVSDPTTDLAPRGDDEPIGYLEYNYPTEGGTDTRERATVSSLSVSTHSTDPHIFPEWADGCPNCGTDWVNFSITRKEHELTTRMDIQCPDCRASCKRAITDEKITELERYRGDTEGEGTDR